MKNRKVVSDQAAINALNEIAAEFQVTIDEMAKSRGVSVERLISNYKIALEHNANLD
ncbi:MAG: hypothetical protein ACI35O_04160 [Bacillaceae bacterium]